MKKQERMENRKRKIAALANIVEINEGDKKSKKANENENSPETKDKVASTSSDTVRFSSDPIESLTLIHLKSLAA